METEVMLLCYQMPDNEPCPKKHASIAKNLILDIVHCLRLKKPSTFQSLDPPPSSGERSTSKNQSLVALLERRLNPWTNTF